MAERSVGRRLKREVRERAREICEYCRSQESFAMQSFSVEHVVPLHAGGESVLDNLALACQGCNNYKQVKVEALDPVTETTAALYHPRRESWTEHFVWSHDFTRLVGLTPTGRATIAALRLNRRGLINLRRALYASGEHPPAEPDLAR